MEITSRHEESMNRDEPATPHIAHANDDPHVLHDPQEAIIAADAAPGVAATRESGHRRMLASAGIIAIGQLLSSILGFVRTQAINAFFWGSASGAFLIGLRPIQQLSDLIIQGSVSGALIPTFVEYGEAARREELRRIYSTIANLVLIVMTVAVISVEILSPVFIPILTPSFSPADQQLTVALVRILCLSLYGLGLYAVTSGLLYALREVVYPAFATGVYHVGIIVCGMIALLASARALGVPLNSVLHPGASTASVDAVQAAGAHGLAIGAAVGALGEFLILLPGLRRVRVVWRPVLDLQHPGVRQILRLYLPLVAGLLISVAQQIFDTYLWGSSPGGSEKNVTALQTGTMLVQFPVGLVAAAFSFAVLPLLAESMTRDDLPAFKRTLGLGFRLGLLLMVPAMVGLIVLRLPIVEMLFMHGRCGVDCSGRNALAVQNYALQLPFVALDQLLIAAFYARKNTLVPTIVGVISIGFYLAVAIPFGHTIGMPALAFANTMFIVSHAIILFILLTIYIGDLGFGALVSGGGRIALAAAVMGLICWAGVDFLPVWQPRFFSLTHTSGQILTFLASGVTGSAVYFALVRILRVEEVAYIGDILARKLGLRRGVA